MQAQHEGQGVEFFRLLISRLIASVFTVFIVITIVFFISRVIGDPIAYLLPIDAVTSTEDIQRIEKEFGLDRPIPVQYGEFLGDMLRGDFGRSFRTKQPALQEVAQRMSKTLQLTVAGLAFSLALGISAGVIAAVYRGRSIDGFARVLALLGQATPDFWLGLMLILFFGVRLGWLPTGGSGDLRHLILPTITLGTAGAASITRITRSAMLEVLSADFIRTARAKGLRERTVIFRHAFRNALLPVSTIFGLQIGRLIAGSAIIETVFAWPGIGRLAINSISTFDYPVAQACIIVISTSIVLGNLAVDLSYQYIDPRIRASGL